MIDRRDLFDFLYDLDSHRLIRVMKRIVPKHIGERIEDLRLDDVSISSVHCLSDGISIHSVWLDELLREVLFPKN